MAKIKIQLRGVNSISHDYLRSHRFVTASLPQMISIFMLLRDGRQEGKRKEGSPAFLYEARIAPS
jgi:hypothetical protein